MKLIGSLDGWTGNRYRPVNSGSPGLRGKSFQSCVTAARAEQDTYRKEGTLAPDLGVPTIQWNYKNYVKGSAYVPAEISEEQLDSLAEEFDLDHMTQESLDLFMDKLVETGVFTREELDIIAYGETCIDGESPEGKYLPYSGGRGATSGAVSEMQEWARTNSFLLMAGGSNFDGTPAFSIRKASALMKLMPVLEQMSYRRG